MVFSVVLPGDDGVEHAHGRFVVSSGRVGAVGVPEGFWGSYSLKCPQLLPPHTLRHESSIEKLMGFAQVSSSFRVRKRTVHT